MGFSRTGATFGCLSAVEAILVRPKPNVTPKIATPALIKALGEFIFFNQASCCGSVVPSSAFTLADLISRFAAATAGGKGGSYSCVDKSMVGTA